MTPDQIDTVARPAIVSAIQAAVASLASPPPVQWQHEYEADFFVTDSYILLSSVAAPRGLGFECRTQVPVNPGVDYNVKLSQDVVWSLQAAVHSTGFDHLGTAELLRLGLKGPTALDTLRAAGLSLAGEASPVLLLDSIDGRTERIAVVPFDLLFLAEYTDTSTAIEETASAEGTITETTSGNVVVWDSEDLE